MKQSVCCIICAKNEERTIREVIRQAKRYADSVIVIDGHSRDKTVSVARSEGVAVYRDDGSGKGNAVRTGLSRSTKPVTVFLDADGSHIISDIPKLTDPILSGTADCVIASRLTGGSDDMAGTLEGHIRAMGSHIITTCINLRFGTHLTESQNGFRAVRTSAAKKITLRQNDTTVEQEMLIAFLKKGLRVIEVPSHENPRQFGRSHVRILTHGWRYVLHAITDLL